MASHLLCTCMCGLTRVHREFLIWSLTHCLGSFLHCPHNTLGYRCRRNEFNKDNASDHSYHMLTYTQKCTKFQAINAFIFQSFMDLRTVFMLSWNKHVWKRVLFVVRANFTSQTTLQLVVMEKKQLSSVPTSDFGLSGTRKRERKWELLDLEPQNNSSGEKCVFWKARLWNKNNLIIV